VAVAVAVVMKVKVMTRRDDGKSIAITISEEVVVIIAIIDFFQDEERKEG